jgi:ribonucleases P/MRP protein subunit RPP40
VSINGCASASARVPSGVPQGSILGPTLFIAYFDRLLQDFKVRFPGLRLQAYADDLVLLVPIAAIDDLDHFGQPALDFIENWISLAGLAFNVAKTQVMVFGYGVLPESDKVSLSLYGQKLVVFTEVQYLGVLFSSDLKFSKHIFNTVKKANSMLGSFNRKFGRHVSPDTLKTVYESCVRSVLEYGCVAWDPILKKDIAELERAQFFALRLFLRDWNLSYTEALDKANWSSLFNRRKRLKLFQFYKYYNGHHDYANCMFVHKDDCGVRTSSRLNQPHFLVLPRHNFESFKQSFNFSCIQMWNNLPYEEVSLPLSSFHDAILKKNF